MAERQPLGEVVYTALYTILKCANVSVGVDKMEVIRRESDRLAKRIENEIKLSVIEKIEKLQDAIVPAFKIIEDRLDGVEKQIKANPTLGTGHIDHIKFKENDGK